MTEVQHEDALSRVATNLALIAGAIATLAEAVNGTYGGTSPPAASAKPRGRGRPVRGGDDTPAAQTTTPAATEPDPFATPEPAVPAATLEEVRKALTALKDAVSQEKALSVLKDAGSAANLGELKADKYGAVVKAAKEALPAPKVAVEPEDPFAIPSDKPVEAAKPATFEDVKAACVDATKITAPDTVQKIVMKHGGKAKNPDSGLEGPSLKALPPENYQKVIDEVKALPKTR